jgi:CRP-like cAMP-binding protein
MTSASASIRRLASLELFAGCRRKELARIDALTTTVDVPAGRVLCEEGTSGSEFFVLVAGRVEVRKAGDAAALLKPGAWFGETALLELTTRRATVIARTQATLLVFGRREFNGLLFIAPTVRRRLEATASRVVDGMAPSRQPWYQPLGVKVPPMSLGA